LAAHVVYSIIWLGSFAIFIFYVTRIADEYIGQKAEPPSRVTYTQKSALPLPQATICNWNQVPDGGDLPDYPFADLSIGDCNQFFPNGSSTKCISSFYKKLYYVEGVGTFYCYEFNNGTGGIELSHATGYGSSFSLIFSVTVPPVDDSLRLAAQATFVPSGEVPDIYNEIKFGPSGMDSFFALTDVYEQHLDENGVFQEPEAHRYTAVSSMTFMGVIPPNDTAYIGISFGFQSLSQQVIVYQPEYTLDNFFADFAGVLGVLLGLDWIKLTTSIPVFYKSITSRKTTPMIKHFH